MIDPAVSLPSNSVVRLNSIWSALPWASLRLTVLVPVKEPSNEPLNPPAVVIVTLSGVERVPSVNVVREIPEISPELLIIFMEDASIAAVPAVIDTVLSVTVIPVFLSKA